LAHSASVAHPGLLPLHRHPLRLLLACVCCFQRQSCCLLCPALSPTRLQCCGEESAHARRMLPTAADSRALTAQWLTLSEQWWSTEEGEAMRKEESQGSEEKRRRKRPTIERRMSGWKLQRWMNGRLHAGELPS